MYLTKKEVAEVLRVSVRTITTYMQQGAIPNPKKIGGILPGRRWNCIAVSSMLRPVQSSQSASSVVAQEKCDLHNTEGS